MRESFSPELAGRYRLSSGDFDFTETYIHPEMVREVHPPRELGALRHPHVTGLIHDETGFPTSDAKMSEESLLQLHDKVAHHPPPVETFAIPFATQAKRETGCAQTANSLTLGAVVGLTSVVSRDSLEQAVLSLVPRGAEELNVRAMEAGVALVPDEWRVPPV